MINNNSISLVVPCKNEGSIIGNVLKRIPNYIDEVIVIDNNSDDDTRDIAKKCGASVYLERKHIKGIGYGFAIRKGLKKSTGDFIVIMDGDKTYPLSLVHKIVIYMLKNDVQFISCSRYSFNVISKMSPIRFVGGFILTQFANLLFSTKINDILSGMWIIDKRIVHLLDLTPGDWNMSISIKLSAAINDKIKFEEYAIAYNDRKNGYSKQSLLNTGLAHFMFILQLRLEAIKNIQRSFRLTTGGN